MTDAHLVSLEFYSLDDLRKVIEGKLPLALSAEARAKIEEGHAFVIKKAAEDRFIYGVNTGFGSLCENRVENDEMEALQYRHVVSHAVGVGEFVPERIARTTLFIKLLTFRTGRTGISLGPVERLIEMWNHGVIPAIPKKGTVGASGDLAPLAHMSLPLLGLGKVHYQGSIVPAKDVLAEKGWQPLKLRPKEGLALTNGVQYINAWAADSLMRIGEIIRAADVIASLSAQAFSTSETYYQAPYHETSYHEDRRIVARNFRRLLQGSNHFQLSTCNKSKQDPYSFRCLPQVHAAIRQTYNFALRTIEDEYNGVSDNPLFFPEHDQILFGGALHGESTALVLDYLAIAITELSNISERRTYQLQSGRRGLPDFLVPNPGLNSGLMIAQYTSAALLNENKVFSTPASADTIPTCQLQEDHVSMGGTCAYKLQTVIENTEHILAIELMHAVQAIDFNKELKLSPVTQAVYDAFRKRVKFLDTDRVVADDMEVSLAFYREHVRSWANDLGLE